LESINDESTAAIAVQALEHDGDLQIVDQYCYPVRNALTAANKPIWRIPAPYRLRHTRALATRSLVESITEPTGAPNPFDKQTEIVSKYFPYSVNATPDATCVFRKIRAPSQSAKQHQVHLQPLRKADDL